MRKNRITNWVVCSTLLVAMSCGRLDEEKIWNNPLDPHGTNWHPPIVHAPHDTVVAFNDTVVLNASGQDENGTVVKYLWSFDHGNTWPLQGTPANPAMYVWGADRIGPQKVWVKAQDNERVLSAPDSMTVRVHRYFPVIRAMNDTIVSQRAMVNVSVSASDTNGDILHYYWKIEGKGSWSDSTIEPHHSFSHAEGGGITVVWAACDHDMQLTCDTFSILFNRGPSAIEMVEPRDGDTVAFNSYNFIKETGNVRFRFIASDPDSQADTLSFTLFLGDQKELLSPVWSGKTNDTIIQNILPRTRYFWKLHVKDLFGDSIASAGSFFAPPSPGGPKGMVLIRSGEKSFLMGFPGGDAYETPVHPVSFSYHFWIDTGEVTREEFCALMNMTMDDGTLPMTGINWYDAALYCNVRSKRDSKDTVYTYTAITGTPGKTCVLDGVQWNHDALGYRLPTESEWEYSCRAGSQDAYFWGGDRQKMDQYVWYRDNSAGSTHAIGTKKPNAFGLYNMYGNVWEWCNDWFDTTYYQVSPAVDPAGPQIGQERVLRGGSYANSDYFAQSGVRSKIMPGVANGTIGFRVVLRHP
jgi:formylglycine-generating enzyme required for sulfatase activity